MELYFSMKRPEFDSINNYDQFKKYSWSRIELREICKEHGLLFIGSEKKLNKVIEAYFNGNIIPPRRNWYTNKLLLSFVNENGLTMKFDFILLGVNLILTTIGIINRIKDADNTSAVLFLVFGITGLIVALSFLYFSKDLEVIRSYGPVCGDRKFTRAEVDEQANSANTVHLNYEDILLAPDMLIGITAGVAAIAYEDIASLQVRQIWHQERVGPRYSTKYREYYTYKIYVKTQKGKRIAISNSKRDGEEGVAMGSNGNREGEAGYAGNVAIKIYEHCLRYNPQVELLDMKKSSMAPNESVKQVTEGKGVKCSVDKAVQEQFLTSISVGEDIKKKFTSFHLRTALILIPESILVSAIAGGIIYVTVRYLRTVRGISFLLVFLLFPLYAIYNLFSILISIHKDDIEFYYGEIAGRSDKGYYVKGVLNQRFGYIKNMGPTAEPCVGDRVIVARLKDGYSLISEN